MPRWCWGAAVLSVGFFVWSGAGMIKASSPTFDEAVHLAAGYQNLAAGTYRLNAMDHPPLAEMWSAVPLLFMGTSALFQHPDLMARRVYNFSDAFLYKNVVPAEKMLDAARLWGLATWGLLLGAALFAWAYRLSGPAGLAWAALFFAFCPVLVSNAAVVTTDTASAVLFFVTFWLLSREGDPLDTAAPSGDGRTASASGYSGSIAAAPCGERSTERASEHRAPFGAARPWWRWAAAGAAMGWAMASKFNMFILPGLVAVMLIAEHHAARRLAGASQVGSRGRKGRSGVRGDSGRGLAPDWLGMLVMAAAAVLALALVYRLRSVGLYADGLMATLRRLGEGRPSFLFGSHSTQGWLTYFPAALLVKTPLPLLLCAAGGLWFWVRSPNLGRFWACGPAAAYFLAALFSKTQIGVRHILPVYPFLILLAADGAARLWRHSRPAKAACCVLAVWLAVSVARVHPHHLAYFNEVVGGPSGGHHALVDSNLDWGQGLKELSIILKDLGNPPVYMCYFGTADPSYYGIRYTPFSFINNVDRREGLAEPGPDDKVLLAVSATNLQAVYYVQKEAFAWLKTREPAAVAAHSIFLYDLTGDRDGRGRLAGVLAGSGHPAAAQRLLAR